MITCKYAGLDRASERLNGPPLERQGKVGVVEFKRNVRESARRPTPEDSMDDLP